MTRRVLRYGDLPREPARGVVLRCPACREDTSAARGDYFEHVYCVEVRCCQCEGPLQLVRRVVSYRPVRA